MKVIVFGGAGFLGSHVADALSDVGYNVTVFDVRPSPYARDGQSVLVGDILDLKTVSDAVRGQDIVFHFAGIADIEEANARPLDTVRTNILGTAVLLEAARQCAVRRFVFASSVYVYSDAGGLYRSSKQACELLVEDYRRMFGLNYTVLRYGSLYGDRADDRNWIHRILLQAVTEGRIVRYGDGEEIREYIHVRDAARCSVDILSPGFENENVVIAGHQAIKIKDLLTMIRELMGNKVAIEYRPPESSPPHYAGLHYQVTPYTFKPGVARKLVSTYYLDLGEGILNCLYDIYGQTTRSDLVGTGTKGNESGSLVVPKRE